MTLNLGIGGKVNRMEKQEVKAAGYLHQSHLERGDQIEVQSAP